MPLILTSGPAAEPIDLAQAKAHLRVDGNDEDAVIASLILAARMHIEQALDLALITQSWSLYLDAWPDDGVVRLPLGPVQSVDAVRLYADDGTPSTLASDAYVVDLASRRARLARRGGLAWPIPGRSVNGIEIAFTAGFGPAAASIPAPIGQALLLLLVHWYEEREPVVLGSPAVIPMTVAGLLAPFREIRL